MPECFLHSSCKGGGVLQGSASESVLVAMLAARSKAFKKHSLCSGVRLVAYCSTLVNIREPSQWKWILFLVFETFLNENQIKNIRKFFYSIRCINSGNSLSLPRHKFYVSVYIIFFTLSLLFSQRLGSLISFISHWDELIRAGWNQ